MSKFFIDNPAADKIFNFIFFFKRIDYQYMVERKLIMECEICKEKLDKNNLIEHRGFVLCEDCYMAALQEGCGWAPFKQKFSSKNAGLNE